MPVGDVIGAYKSLTTDEYIRGVHDQDWPSFPGRLWQRNYFEHIVRDDDEIDRIRTYIADNPRQWEDGDMNFEPVV
jgi:REP element-mobilizing transposase RayT